MTEAEITDTLQIAATSAVAASIVPTLPIAFIDVSFKQPNSGKYLELVQIRNNDDQPTWGENQRFAGIFRMLLHWPKSGDGAIDPLELLGSIASYFHKGMFLPGGLKIVTSPNVMSSIASAHENLYPVSVRYERFE